MTLLSRDQVVDCLRCLPALPAGISELLDSFADEDVDVDQIAGLIGRNQGLTARVLRVANSSFYGLQSKVGTISEAVVVLGFRAVRSMALAIGMGNVFHGEQCAGFDERGYARHCAAVGLAARGLASVCGQNAELAFTGGVLHDIGRLVLAANFPAQYAEVLVFRQREDCFIVEAERLVLGIDHGEVGGLLAESWHFPVALRAALACHHAPDGNPVGDLVHIADALAHALGTGGHAEEMVMPVDDAAWQRLGLNSAVLAGVPAVIEREMEETCRILRQGEGQGTQ